jgi:hypothetical protein
LALLALANITRVVLERHTAIAADPRDGIVGLLFGLAFGCVFLGIWKTRRAKSHGG